MKLLKKQLEIFSSARAIRQASKERGKLAANQITIADFFAYFTRSNLPRASQALRTFCMHKASQNARKQLKLSEDFLNFLKDKDYLFSFFEELAAQNVSINELKNSDIYSFFDEYLISLEQVQKHYIALLGEYGCEDVITSTRLLPNHYLLDQYDEIKLFLDGFLKRYEEEFLRALPGLKIYAECSKFNAALLEQCFNLRFEKDYEYEIVYQNNAWCAKKINEIKIRANIIHAGFKSHSLQYLYVLNAIAQDVVSGIEPEQIVVILCDEGQISTLKSLDVFNYINIAKGLKDVAYEQKLAAILGCNDEPMSKQTTLLKNANLAAKTLDDAALLELASDATSQKQLALQLAQLAELGGYIKLDFAQKLKMLSPILRAHVGGGTVSAIGALEARAIAAKSVIICDFNDEVVPARANVQMYLNAALRKRAGLISDAQRENLQRHYYYALIAKAQKVRLLYVDNEEAKPARFLKEFSSAKREEIDEKALIESYAKAAALRPSIKCDESVLKDYPQDAKAHKFNDFAISYSRLATLERSGAEYYFKYILNIQEPRALVNDAKNKGIKLHKLLEFARFGDEDEFLAPFLPELAKQDFLNALISRKALLALNRFVCEQDYKSFAELEIRGQIDGLELVGCVDRYFQNGLMLDYKNSANVTNSEHAKQFAFYSLILNHLKSASCKGEKVELAPCDFGVAFNIYLKSPSRVIVQRQIDNEEKLLTKLKAYSQDFTQAGFKSEQAYGYFYLLANKKRSKL